jgi:hypothetical protein
VRLKLLFENEKLEAEKVEESCETKADEESTFWENF